MSNMETLGLYLKVGNRFKFIDGADLNNEIIIYMPQIITFKFSITTVDNHIDIKYWLKDDDIEDSLVIDDANPYIHCCIDYFKNGIGRCHIASLPFM